MSLINMALDLSSSPFENQKNTAVAVKAMQSTKAQGEAAVAMIKQAADIGKVAQAAGASPPGVGERIDLSA